MSDCRIFEISEGAEVWWDLAPSEWEARTAWFHSEKEGRGYRTVEGLLHNLSGKLRVRRISLVDAAKLRIRDETQTVACPHCNGCGRVDKELSLLEVYHQERVALSGLDASCLEQRSLVVGSTCY